MQRPLSFTGKEQHGSVPRESVKFGVLNPSYMPEIKKKKNSVTGQVKKTAVRKTRKKKE